ncbi:MAG: hypothetical protein BHW02_04785 [Clostridium sp. 28_12]|nr:MAG: hypothetical protein BHW02_04785 [Clostridium sp. 28_12]
MHALPTVTKETTRFRQGEALGYKILKRIVDIIGALFGIIMLVPMTIGIYIANLIVGDNGPIFYSQNRIGKDGKIFKMYKFRSMVMGADEKLEKYLEENEEARKEYKINKKLKDDPRVTKIGKFIRKTSIDEFPQFVNVLKGDMSLVGPRPYLPREIDDMGKAYPYITAVKPGVTGLWQVSGRNDVTFEERLDLDIQYYKQKGIKSDMKLLGKTVKKVAFKEGAR